MAPAKWWNFSPTSSATSRKSGIDEALANAAVPWSLYVQQGLAIVASGSAAARKCGCSLFWARVWQSRVSFHSLWDSRRFESAKIALNAGKQSGLTEGY